MGRKWNTFMHPALFYKDIKHFYWIAQEYWEWIMMEWIMLILHYIISFKHRGSILQLWNYSYITPINTTSTNTVHIIHNTRHPSFWSSPFWKSAFISHGINGRHIWHGTFKTPFLHCRGWYHHLKINMWKSDYLKEYN